MTPTDENTRGALARGLFVEPGLLRGLVETVVQEVLEAEVSEFPGVAWQRCKVHLMREMLGKVSWRDRKDLAGDLRAIYASDEIDQCRAVGEEIAAKWDGRAPRMSAALRSGLDDALTVWQLPARLRK